MTTTTNNTVPDEVAARDLVRAMVAELKDAYPRQVTPLIEQAMHWVPRHLFCPPGTTLEAAYANSIVPTRTDATGRITSSVSAPWLQARMLYQARVERGMRILEVGSGGYNAALLAELVGPTGQVVTVDIDPVVVQATRAALAATRYTDRVTVVHADGAKPLGLGDFDRIVITVGVWDVAPAWIEQLTADGVLVVPLRARHSSECWSIAFHREGDLLVGESSLVCGFVDVQGAARLEPDTARITGPRGGVAVARSWDHGTDLSRLPEALPSDRAPVPSGVVMPPPGMFVGLRTRLAYDLPGLVGLTFEDRDLLEEDGWRWLQMGHVDGESFAVLCVQEAREVDGGSRLGAVGFGPRGEQAALTLVDHVEDWGQDGMPQRAAHVYRPVGSTGLLTGRVLSLERGDLAVTQHHDGADDI